MIKRKNDIERDRKSMHLEKEESVKPGNDQKKE